MLHWWSAAGVERADLAVRRSDGTMIWHHDLGLEDLPLPWARAENVRRAEIYIRPARGVAWPIVLVDDVSPEIARKVAARTSSLVIRTSAIGGCHLWLRCRCRLDEAQRRDAQRWLARRLHGDPASVSGEHLGRLAGFKNWKRRGCWVNVLDATRGEVWDPRFCITTEGPKPAVPANGAGPGRDTSPSAREWGWVCARLEAGQPPDDVLRRLIEKARSRRRREPERYATRTVQRAIHHVAIRWAPPRPRH